MKTKSRIASLSIAVFLGLSAFAPLAYAHDEPCRDDFKKFCGNMKPGGGSITDCMKTHESELSPACKSKMVEGREMIKAKREEMKEACKADLQQFCANVTPGEGREFSCLWAYNDKVSAACKEKMHPGMPMHPGMMGHHGDKDDAHRPPPPGK